MKKVTDKYQNTPSRSYLKLIKTYQEAIKNKLKSYKHYDKFRDKSQQEFHNRHKKLFVMNMEDKFSFEIKEGS